MALKVMCWRQMYDPSGHDLLRDADAKHVRFQGDTVAKLFSRRRNVIIESKSRRKRLILTEMGAATNQYCIIFP